VGIFDRFRRLISSNLNDMISKSEDPEKMLNQLIQEMNQQLIDSKKSVASAIADEKKLERQINEVRAQSADWERRAMSALRNNEEDLARQALERKQRLDGVAAELQEQWQAQHDAVEKLKEALRSLQTKIDEAQRKKNLLIARSKRAEAQRRMQKTIGGMKDTSAFEVFEKMTKQMEQLEAENEAVEELNRLEQTDDLEEQFRRLEGTTTTTDRLLADLKTKMAIGEPEPGATAKGASPDLDRGRVPDSIDADLDELKRRMQDDG